MGTRTLPELGPNRPLTLPTVAERTLPTGLTVLAVRRSSVPLVEVRLRVPFARADLARTALLTQTLLSGTINLSYVQIAAQLQAVGGALSATADPDRLLVSGNALVSGLDRILAILAEVVTGATFPQNEVATERDRLADRIRVAETQPAHLARVAQLKRVYGTHPYAVQTPSPEQVLAVTPAGLRELHAGRVHPNGATLVLVGDVDPQQAIDTAERALAGWNGSPAPVDLPPAPPIEPGPLTLVDRPGSVQSSLRLTLPAVPRTHPDHAALTLANLIFGGYFSSRWVENIREDKGYTYSPHSLVEHSVAGSTVSVATDVATEVTAPALLETVYELGRMATSAPSGEELEQARRYALGTLLLGVSTQAGLAGLASSFAGFDLRLDYLAEHAERLAKATPDDVAAAAARYLAPSRAAVVVLGDAERIAGPLATVMPLTATPGSAPGTSGASAESVSGA